MASGWGLERDEPDVVLPPRFITPSGLRRCVCRRHEHEEKEKEECVFGGWDDLQVFGRVLARSCPLAWKGREGFILRRCTEHIHSLVPFLLLFPPLSPSPCRRT